MQQPQVVFRREQHRGHTVLAMYMEKNAQLNAIAKKLGAKWSATKTAWYIPFGKHAVNTAFKAFKDVAWVDYSALQQKRNGKKEIGKNVAHSPPAVIPRNEESLSIQRKPSPALSEVEVTVNRQHTWTEAQKAAMWQYADKLKIRRYSQSTFTTYGVYFKQFLAAHPNTDPKEITEEQIKKHIIVTVKAHNYANKTQNQMVNAIKFYYEQVLGLSKHKYWIPRPRKEFKLPVVASEEEVIRLIVAAKNLKHQCIIGMLYSTGLRRGELINLQIEDINVQRKQVFVRGGKGKKDRVTMLSTRMINALNRYYELYSPKQWVFEGANGEQYSGSSVAAILRNACKVAGIRTKITPHVLRHSFATHLMDKGIDTRYIQELLGHKNLNTTAIYAHVSIRDLESIKSPLDRIFDDKQLKNNYLR